MALWTLVSWYYKPSTSWRYRKYLTNLYVASFLRKKAREEQLDLDLEEKNLLLYDRTSTMRRMADLDDKIERALAEEMEEKILNKEK
mgnify:CR=1 FL=1